MNTKIVERRHYDDLHASGLAFWMISLMHDNPLLPHLKNPYRSLEIAGLKPGQKVLEVGCGPGFFTIPAAKMVGEKGVIYAVDVNQRAIKRVEEKMHKLGMDNIKPILGNAANSGLQEGSIDLAFIFGLRYIADGLSNLILEMYRILKPRGILSFDKTTGSGDKLVEEIETMGFITSDIKGRIYIFTKKEFI
jgi:ubiquinone/menaquinone biosynthesis C-methylase UbiE